MALQPSTRERPNFLQDSTLLVDVLSIVFPLVSAYATWDGLHKLTGNMLWAILGAAVAGLFIGAFYRLYLLRYPTAKPQDRRKLIIPMIVFGIFAVALTTPFSVTSFGGDIALRENMNGSIKEGERRINERLEALRAEQSLGASLGQYAQQFKDLASQEENGAFTGVTGRGSAAVTFATVGQTLARMQEQVRANQAVISGYKDRSTQILNDLRATTYARVSQQEKQARFAAGLANLNDLMSQMDAASVVPSVQQAAGSLKAVAALQVSDSGTEVGAKQSVAIGKAQNLVSEVQKEIDKAATSVKAASSKKLEPLSVIDQGKAIFVYWQTIPWAWALALALDFSPLLFLFILSVVNDTGKGRKSRKKPTAAETTSIVRPIRGGR